MGLVLNYDEGQTPLDEDEKEGLLISSVTTKAELDELEQGNIEQAMLWAMQRRRSGPGEVLKEAFIKEVHVKMFGKVWKWAGTFRNSNKNLGVDKYAIGTTLRTLLDDCSYWIANKTFPEDEIAIRFKHRIVSVHCFVNGNGRHSRLMADIIAEKVFNREVFTWGSKDLIRADESRQLYLHALREADKGNYIPLLAFARS
jgi:Fic-DOC domain mobile mystery protein B